MKELGIMAGLVVVGCSEKPPSTASYEEILHCEMRVLVVANFTPSSSLAAPDRVSLQEKAAALSKSMLEKAASLKKSNADILADQRRILTEIQGRVQGPSADAEALKLMDEARSCGE
jgi:hypothetical protein